MTQTKSVKVLVTGLLILFSSTALARDLALKNLQVIKVSPCDRQIRFSVADQSAPGETKTGPYQIQVFSLDRNKLIENLSVENQDANETLYFVVPYTKLKCDHRVRIKIDPQNAVGETNKKNNAAIVKLERPKAGNLAQACYADRQLCS